MWLLGGWIIKIFVDVEVCRGMWYFFFICVRGFLFYYYFGSVVYLDGIVNILFVVCFDVVLVLWFLLMFGIC